MSLFLRKLNDLKSIKLNVKSLNEYNGHLIAKMMNLFQRMQKTIYFSNFYQEYLQKNTMGVFQNWNAESIQLDVLEQEIITDWPELYIYMKPFLTFYVIDMNNMVQDELLKARKKSTDEKLIRFLIFNCNPELLQNMDNESLFIIIPELNDEKLMIYLEDQLQMFVCQVIEYFAYEILRLKSDQSLLVLFNMREEKISEQSKLKRRRQGRQYKIMGDMALMIQANQDALEYYRQALEILNKVGDNLWAAITYQSMAALRSNQDEIEEHFREALILFKKTKFVNLEIECFFKLMKLKCDWGDKLGLDKTVDIFTKTFDPESPVEKCKLYCFLSELYGKLKMVRKEAFHLKLASNQIYSINRQMSLELMQKAAKLYQMSSLFDGNTVLFWDSMQRSLAQEINQFFVESKHYTQIQIVQLFKEDFSNQKLLGYFEELKEDSKVLQLHEGNLPLIPQILNLRILNHDYLLKEEHCEQIEDEIFIVNPWAHKEKKIQLYPKDLEIYFELEVENIYSFPLNIELIQLQFEGCECLVYPKSVNILQGKQNISLYLTPKNEGQLRIFGIKIQYMNYQYIHKIEEQIIKIIESLPNVDAFIYRDHCLINDVDAVYFDPSEIFTYQIIIQNKGDRIIDHCSFELCIEAEDPPIYETKQEIISFNLDAYSKTTLLLSESAGIIIPKIPHSIKSCKKISLSFFFYYQKQKYQREIRLNRQVQIRPKCAINQCLFITKYQSQDQMEIYDLQDTCYLSLQIKKFQFLLELELKSQILLDGSFKTILNEDINTYSKVLKLCKLPQSKLDDPDLSIHWRNPLNGSIGQLKPLDSLTKEDMFKHFCNDLIEIHCKEEKRQLSYKLTIHQQLSTSEEILVNISLTNEIVNCSKSVVSSIKNQTAVIVDGFTNYKLKLNKNEPTIKQATLSIMCNGPLPDLKFMILDKQNNRQFIKRTSIN